MTHTSKQNEIEILPGYGRIVSIARPQSNLRLPHVHSSRPASGLLAMVVALSLVFTPHQTRAAGYSGATIVSETNDVRQQNGLSALTTNSLLEQAAQAKAADMFARQYFNHYSPTGQAPWVWIQQSGYAFTNAGENLAIDFVDGADVMNAWMHSTTHRQNLLSTKYSEIGVAVVDGTMNGVQTTLVVQFFGSQQVAPVAAPAPVISAPKVISPKPVIISKPKVKAIINPKPVTQVVTHPAPELVPVAEPVIPAVAEQPQVLGVSDENIPSIPEKTHKTFIPVTYVQVNTPSLAQSRVSQGLPSVLLATFAGYMALFSLAGVLAYLHKSITLAAQKRTLQPAIALL